MRRANQTRTDVPSGRLQAELDFPLEKPLGRNKQGMLVIDCARGLVHFNERFRALWSLDAETTDRSSCANLRAALAAQVIQPEPAVAALLSGGGDRNRDDAYVFFLTRGRVLEARRIPGQPSAGEGHLQIWGFRDITGRAQPAKRDAFLARIARLLVSFDLESMLQEVTRAALPLLGETCAVDWAADGPPRRLMEVSSGTALSTATGTGTGRKRRARLTVPLEIHGSRSGTLTFSGRPGVAYSSWQRKLAQELADHLALAIQHCQAHRQTAEAAANREQLLFLVAHELRNPLASLRMGVETLRFSQPDSARSLRLLEVIGRDERRLTGMISDLLDLGRIRSGQLDLELGPVDLADVAREAVTRIEGEIARSGSQVTVEANCSVVGLWDRRRLDQVVSNLLANAIKFGRGRPVLLRVEGDGSCGRLSVVDRGVGMAPEVQRRIFEPFVSTGESRRAGGLGLGLHIVRTIVRSLGGEVRVESTLDQGATFTVDLPCNRRAA